MSVLSDLKRLTKDRIDVDMLHSEPDMGDTDRAAIAELKVYMGEHYPEVLLDADHIGPGGDFKLTRFLRSEQHDIPNTARRLVELVQFRREYNVGAIRISHVADSIARHKVHIYGKTKAGQIALSYKVSHMAYDGLSTLLCMLYFLETIDTVFADSFQLMLPIIDVSEMHVGLFESHITHKAANGDVLHRMYPRRMINTIIINPSDMFKAVVTIARNTLAAAHGSHQLNGAIILDRASNKILADLFEPANVPVELGGPHSMDFDAAVQECYAREGIKPGTTASAPIAPHIRLLHRGMARTADKMPAVRRGPIRVLSLRTGEWRACFAVLTAGAFFYFTSADCTIPNNSIPIQWVVATPLSHLAEPHSMKVTTARRDYCFAFDTAEDRDGWLEAVGAELNKDGVGRSRSSTTTSQDPTLHDTLDN